MTVISTMSVACMTRAHTCTKHISAAIAARSKVVVMAVSAVELVVLGRERLVDQRTLAVTALETLLMPVSLLVREILQHNVPYNTAVMVILYNYVNHYLM